MNLSLERDTFTDTYTLGKFYVDGKWFGFTCEDAVREDPNPATPENEGKVYAKTAIPCGTYEVVSSFSNRFQHVLPELLDVPGFKGIRIHGGNTHENTEGCILLGSMRTKDGVANCAPLLQRLLSLLEEAEAMGSKITLEIT